VSGGGVSWRLSGTILYAADVARHERTLQALSLSAGSGVARRRDVPTHDHLILWASEHRKKADVRNCLTFL
jgi:hypothetical protein